jgi:signal transduction histidine kinase
MSRAYLPTWRQTAAVELYTVLLAWSLTALTRQPFLEGWRYFVPVSLAQLLAYCAASARHPRWMPLSLARLAAVALMAPVAAVAMMALPRDGRSAGYLATAEGVASAVALALIALVFGLLFTAVALYLQRKARERQAERERLALERDLLDARLRLLQAQIEPHFLFNTLANVLALVESGSPQAAPVLRHLIAYLRAAMPRLADAEATLDTELQLVRAYLELMRMRMPDRLQFTLAVEPELGALRFPAMALLTLVENAVKHGIDPSMTGGRIEVGGRRDGRAVTLWVADNGVGLSESAGPGTGLANVKARLQACYGNSAQIEMHEASPHGLRAELHFHCEDLQCTTVPSPH